MADSKIPQANIDGAVRMIRASLAPGADTAPLHRALELLTTEETAPAPAVRHDTTLARNTNQPTTGVPEPDPNAPPFHGTVGGDRNAIEAARAADGEDPIRDTGDAGVLGGADAGAANMDQVGGGAGTPASSSQDTGRTDDDAGTRVDDASATAAPQSDATTGANEADNGGAAAGTAEGGAGPGTDTGVTARTNTADANDADAGDDANRDAGSLNLNRKAERQTLLDRNVDDVKRGIKTASVAELTKLREDEVNGKTRQGVLDAIDAQLERLGS